VSSTSTVPSSTRITSPLSSMYQYRAQVYRVKRGLGIVSSTPLLRDIFA
jgi:hypothetical protein